MKRLLPDDCGWCVESAGVFAEDGSPASRCAVEALREKGIDISAHRSQPLTAKLIAAADLLITMTDGHRRAVLSASPESRKKVFLLKSFGTAKSAADIFDPVGEPLEVYRQVRDEIDAALADLVIFIMTKENDYS